jgi:hypothetical protein
VRSATGRTSSRSTDAHRNATAASLCHSSIDEITEYLGAWKEGDDGALEERLLTTKNTTFPYVRYAADQRAPYRMIAAPTRQMAAPAKSVALGVVRSTIRIHTSELAM